MKLYQVIAPEGEGYFIVQGLVIAGRAPAILPEFKRVTRDVPSHPRSRLRWSSSIGR